MIDKNKLPEKSQAQKITALESTIEEMRSTLASLLEMNDEGGKAKFLDHDPDEKTKRTPRLSTLQEARAFAALIARRVWYKQIPLAQGVAYTKIIRLVKDCIESENLQSIDERLKQLEEKAAKTDMQ